MTLFHYSPLVHLSAICREGLTRGDIAHPDLRVLRTAVSLTTQADPDRLCCWGEPLPERTAVRYVCRLADGDARLVPSLRVWKGFGLDRKTIRALDPCGQAKWWSFYFGTIEPRSFSVELRGSGGYAPVSAEDLARIAAEVGAVRDKFDAYSPPETPHARYLVLKDEADPSPLALLDETHPADRLLVRRSPAG